MQAALRCRGPGSQPGPPGGDWNETVIPVGGGSEGFDVTPNGAQAWVANARDGTLSVIDIAAKKVTATLQANARGANRLKFTPDGTKALVSAGGDLVIFDVATQKEIKRLHIGTWRRRRHPGPARRPARLRVLRC